MSINSKKKRDLKRKKKKSNIKNIKTKNKESINSLTYNDCIKGLEKLISPKNLTTPNSIDESIVKFCKSISSSEPFFLASSPEPWSRQSCCDLNVMNYTRIHGGQMIAGYKIWYHRPKYIEAERHAVWFKDGEFKDISFNPDGEEKILFLPDEPDKQSSLDANRTRIRWCRDAYTKELIRFQEQSEALFLNEKMDSDKAWETMLTYEDWLKGKRMSNLIF